MPFATTSRDFALRGKEGKFLLAEEGTAGETVSGKSWAGFETYSRSFTSQARKCCTNRLHCNFPTLRLCGIGLSSCFTAIVTCIIAHVCILFSIVERALYARNTFVAIFLICRFAYIMRTIYRVSRLNRSTQISAKPRVSR